jgi:protease I
MPPSDMIPKGTSKDTSKGTFLILVGPEYEDLEVWYPKLRVEEAGFETRLAGIGEPLYHGKHGYPCPVDGHVRDFPADQLVGILAPGGWAPDKLRRDPVVLERVRQVHEAGKLVATICHGPWILISAGIVRGRRLTSTVGIRDDVVNAGAHWVDQPVVTDGNLVSARVPKDLPAFGQAIVTALTTSLTPPLLQPV